MVLESRGWNQLEGPILSPPFVIHSGPKFAPTCCEQGHDLGSRMVPALLCPLGRHSLGTDSQIHDLVTQVGGLWKGRETFLAWTIGEVPKPSWVPNHDKHPIVLSGMKPSDREDSGQASPKQEIVITGHISMAPTLRQALG